MPTKITVTVIDAMPTVKSRDLARGDFFKWAGDDFQRDGASDAVQAWNFTVQKLVRLTGDEDVRFISEVQFIQKLQA